MSGILTPHVVHYIAQECHWQGSGELSVSWMLEAWQYAHRRRHRAPRRADVLNIGRLVEPFKNEHGIRTVDVRVGEDVKLHHEHIRWALRDLMYDTELNSKELGVMWPESVATHWFQRYEDIHPFRDGNGRSGSLFYNWLRGSLSEPIHAPDLWKDRRRAVVGYPDPLAINGSRRSYRGDVLR